MNKKIQFLLPLLLFVCTSCTLSTSISVLKDPPTDSFVKVFKELEVTRCLKANPDKCETRKFYTSGSGIIIDIAPGYTTVLSAGHVCEEGSTILPQDKLYQYSWNEKLKILDKNKNFHDGMTILTSQATPNSSDLCTIYSETLQYLGRDNKVKLAPRAPRVGEDVYYIGAPLGIYHPPTALIVRGTFSGKIDNFSSLASVPAAGGASGSPILSLDNRVYGVLFAVHPAFKHATIITGYQETKKFIEKTRKLLKK